ncbi:hypothetical protein R6Q57_019127 [Mikania cordata]
MSSETSKITSEITNAGYLNETELTLGLPGESRGRKLEIKRRLSETIDVKSSTGENFDDNQSDTECSDATNPNHDKEEVFGWPPVNLHRKNTVNGGCKFVKVAVDGAPYLRKVDLESYTGYQDLQCALMDIFSSFTVENALIAQKLVDLVNRIKYVSTYEDKDGDWMLVGDVPWKLFVQTCKRIRLMRSSDVNVIIPRS